MEITEQKEIDQNQSGEITTNDSSKKSCCCKHHVKRKATWDDRAVLVSFGVILGAMPAAFSAIAAHSPGHADIPLFGYVLFGALGLWIIANAFNRKLEIEYDQEETA